MVAPRGALSICVRPHRQRRPRMIRVHCVLIPIFACAPLRAQVPEASPPLTLRPNEVVRLRAHDGLRIEGRLLEVDGSSQRLRISSLASPVSVSDIDSLWVRRRATGTGAIVGAAAGGMLLFVPNYLICGSEGPCDDWGTLTAATLGGAAAGALLGAAVGMLFPKWRLRYAGQSTFRLTVGPAPLLIVF